MRPTSYNPKYTSPLMALSLDMVEELLATETKRLNEQLEAMMQECSNAGGTKAGFIIDGQILSTLTPHARRGQPIGPAPAALEDKARTHLKLREKVENDRQSLRQGLSLLTSRCKTKAEFRDALPESLVQNMTIFRGMTRTHEEGSFLDQHPILKRQFERVIEIALYYQANKLIF